MAVVAADANACEECSALADRVYLPRHLPALPNPACTAGECRCRYEPQVTVVE